METKSKDHPLGFPKTVLIISDPKGGAKDNMEKVHKIAYEHGRNFMQIEKISEIETLFSPEVFLKLNSNTTGKLDDQLVAADLREEKTVCVVFGDDVSEINAKEIALDIEMSPIGSVAVFLYLIHNHLD